MLCARISCIAVLVLCFGRAAYPQQADSLKRLIATLPDDSLKVNSLIALSTVYLDLDLDSAILYGEQARELAVRLNFRSGIGWACKAIAFAHVYRSDYSEAAIQLQNALEAFESIGFKSGAAGILGNLGVVYFNTSQDSKAIDFHLRSLRLGEELQDTLRIATAYLNLGAVYSNKEATLIRAVAFYRKALPLFEVIKDAKGLSLVSMNLGEIYVKRHQYDSAIQYFARSIEVSEGTIDATFPLTFLGDVYAIQKNYASALRSHQEAIRIAERLDARLELAQSLIGLARTQRLQNQVPATISTLKRAEGLAAELEATKELKTIYEQLSGCYAEQGNFRAAYSYEQLLNAVKDSLYNTDEDKKIQALQFNFDLEKKQSEINNLERDKELQNLVIERQRLVNIAVGITGVMLLIMAIGTINRYRYVKRTNKIIQAEKDRSEELLLNILPRETAKELELNGSARPRYYESVTVLFTDFKGFSSIAGKLTPQELVAELNDYFVAFDEIVGQNNLEKIKTIGDAYMCAGGIPSANTTHPLNAVKAAMAMQEFMRRKGEERRAKGLIAWDLRIGIHTGPIVAGVVGKKKYAYDIWGDTVNIASRMESGGEPGRVNISAATYALVRNQFACTHRGRISAKNIGEIDMYFVEQELIRQPA
jgi:class 3 adenylate cyclase